MLFPPCLLSPTRSTLIAVLWLALQSVSAGQISFNRDVRPILSKKCFECHGPDASSREAGLRLDLLDPDEGPFRTDAPALVPGSVDDSPVWQRITTEDPDSRMPPPDAEKSALTEKEIATIKAWISAGARYEKFWAFQPPRPTDPQVLTLTAPAPARNRLDHLIARQWQHGEAESMELADRRTLLRRLSLDLTGLPPTLEQIKSFLNDQDPGSYERAVDRLLASPGFGEHMARYWLDVVRFADTNGIHHDHYREMTPYRDWVIRAFNSNLPFDQFIVDQIAGDLHESPTQDQLIASGFNRLHLVIDRGTAIPQESFTRNVVDRVSAVGTAFMGLTLGCAVCHDHKYDPISQRDFYQLYAFFNNIDSEPETPGKNLHAPFLQLPTDGQRQLQAQLAGEKTTLEARVAQSETIQKELQTAVDSAREAADAEQVAAQDETDTADDSELQALEARLAEATKALEAQRASLNELNAKIAQLQAQISVTLIMKERAEVRPAHILVRGAYDQPGEIVERNTPDFLPKLPVRGSLPDRLDLARWLVADENPLTARVTVNRLWQRLFGIGLVKTSEDFGVQGEWPSNPELLDELAQDFVRSGWDVKSLLRTMVNSHAYRLTSAADEALFETDKDNRRLARGSRYRLDAEVIRDQILFASGLLSNQMFGRSVKPPQPPDLWKNVSMVSSSTYAFQADAGEKIHRRSVYSFWKRALPPPQMTIFDAPTREACIARRERTNTPLQALVLMNEQQYFDAAIHLAARTLQDSALETDAMRLSDIYERTTSQLPDDSELERLLSGLNQLRDYYQDQAELREAMLSGQPAQIGLDSIDWAAYAVVVNAVFNLDLTKTRQ